MSWMQVKEGVLDVFTSFLWPKDKKIYNIKAKKNCPFGQLCQFSSYVYLRLL